MKVIIAGSRFEDRDETTRAKYKAACDKGMEAYQLLGVTEVVSGTCRGADRIGEQWAKCNGVAVRRFPAEWDRLGRGAGHIRNAQMAVYADALLALWDGKSPGTRNMIQEAKTRGLLVWIERP